jgi:bacterioferritin
MKHADMVIKRILFLEGLPNVQKINKIRVGQDITEVINADLEVETEAVPHLKTCIKQAEAEFDYATRDLFLQILKSEEHHIDWLETQRDLIKAVGVQNYMQSQIDPDKGAE